MRDRPSANDRDLDQFDTPLVSVIIPAYDAERFILDAVQSITDQDYPSIEVLLIDDGSRDGTVQLVEHDAPWVRVIQQTNAGAGAARNTGLRHATGELICYLDADDGWFPGKVKAQVRYLRRNPTVGAVYHNWLVWNPDDGGNYRPLTRPESAGASEIDPVHSGWIYSNLLLDCVIHTSTAMIRRDVAKAVGEFNPSLRTGEDYDYWLRLSRQCEIHKLNGIYSYYRAVPSSLTGSPNSASNEYQVLKRAIERWGLSSPNGTGVSEDLLKKRLAALAFDSGYAHYHRGSKKLARAAFTQALRHDPLRWRAFAYLIATLIR
jgi:glycosyltransferase involved in cell wall biosynthesis